jgi:DNA replication protein DnaC
LIADPSCPKCHGSGFIVKKDEKGYEYAEKCDCTFNYSKKIKLKSAKIPKRYGNCNFNNYKPMNDSQEKALKSAKKFSADYPSVSGGIFFQGPAGVGKTHLSIAIIKELIERKGVDALFYDVRDLISEIQSKINIDAEGYNKILERVYNVDVLILDDIGAHRISDWTEDIISKIINKRYNNKKITIFSSNYMDAKEFYDDLAEVKGESLEERIGYRLRSRMYEMSRLIILRGADFRKKYLKNTINI